MNISNGSNTMSSMQSLIQCIDLIDKDTSQQSFLTYEKLGGFVFIEHIMKLKEEDYLYLLNKIVNQPNKVLQFHTFLSCRGIDYECKILSSIFDPLIHIVWNVKQMYYHI